MKFSKKQVPLFPAMFGTVLAVQTAGPTVQKLKNFNQISIKVHRRKVSAEGHHLCGRP